jgi:PAS domain S-box-containing protein
MTHPSVGDYRELAQRAGLRACWSEPVTSWTGEILGTLAMYYREPRGPDESDLEFIRSAAHLAGIAIGRKQAAAALQRAHGELEQRVKERTAELAAANEQLSHKIIEHEGTEQALRESAQRLRQLTENIREVFWITSADGREMVYVSPAYEEIWGRTCQSLYKQPTDWSNAIHAEDRDRVTKAFFQGTSQAGFNEEYRIVRPDSSLRWIWDRGFPIRNDAGEVHRIAGIAEDITERKRAEDALRESEQRFRSAFDHTAVGMALVDLNGRFSQLNTVFCEMLGYREDELRGRSFREFTHPEDMETSVDNVQRLLNGEQPMFTLEKRYLHKNGSVVWALTSVATIPDAEGKPRYLVAETQDITERKRAEAALAMHQERLEALVEARTAELQQSHARLRMTDRLASIGTLTAGVVHDVNNVTMPIRCQLEALKRKPVPEGLRRLVESTHEAVEYLQQLARGLRALADDPKAGDPSDQATVLSDWWVEVKPLMSTALPEQVELDSDLPSNLPPVRIAASRLSQVVLSLISNGVEAMGEHGRLRIWAKADLDEQVMRLGVSDNGAGMTEEVKARAFDPFFTTKPRDRSTGLGLWVVHHVARAAGGTVEIESKPKQGTSVVLSLPLAKPAPAEDVKTDGRGRATVSLSDPHAAKWVTNVLDAAGYDVRDAQNGNPDDSAVWVTEPTEANLPTARRFASGSVDRRIITLGRTPMDWIELGAAVVEDPRSLTALRSAVEELTVEARRKQT